jgi:hypothetical protein
MHSFLRTSNLLRGGLLALALASVLPGAIDAKPRPGLQKRLTRLLAGTNGALTVNRIYCGLSAIGNICVDSLGSSTVGGGYWPKGTADQYVFNSGLQIAGIIDPAAGFDWAGHITGAQLFSPRGDDHGEPIEPIYNAASPDDLTNWPQAAFVPQGDAGEENFNPLLRGRSSASQGDVWWISWEGNPSLSAGRSHPLGVMVEQRGMGWNYPAGNEDILYFIYTFYNVTSSDPASYAAIRPGMREIAQEAGANFQRLNEGRFRIQIPDGGYTLTNLFAAFGADMDVAQADANYSTVVVPFALGNTYEHTFAGTDEWTFDPGIFSAPFFEGAGFVGVKYLKSPVDPTTGEEVGLTLFSNTINQGAFDDASNVTQLYRYLSNQISPAAGDAACTFPQATRICYVNNGSPDDMRFFQSSGPLTLAPGEFQSIVVAYIFAAPVAVGDCTSAGSCDLIPGDPTRWLDPAVLSAGANPVDSVAGFLDYSDANADGVVQQVEVVTVPGSLLGKALVAQKVFDERFLLPFAPETPNFFLVAGNNQVTVLWQPSVSETTGDPFFAIAQQPTTVPEGGGDPVPNVLFDPNYRQFDVEGYRIYRGRVDAPNSLTMIAQFDYSGTFIRDFRGGVLTPTITGVGCAPELGINVVTITPDPADPTVADTTFGCPVPFDSTGPGEAPTVFFDIPLVGPIIQVPTSPPGSGRLGLATGNVINTRADTAITGAAFGCAGFAQAATDCQLKDNGVPFVFADGTARNNVRYFYSVTAFDLNSFQSGPSSLESPRVTKSVIPSASASNVDFASQTEFTILGGDGNPIAPGATGFAIDASTGRFNGRPPANLDVSGEIEQSVLRLAPAITGSGIVARIDSVKARADHEAYPLDNITSFNCQGLANGQGLCQEYFLTYTSSVGTTQTRTPARVPILEAVFGDEVTDEAALTPGPVPIDPTLGQQFGIPAGLSPPAAGVTINVPRHGDLSAGENFYGRRVQGGISPGGSRWFSGDNETIDDPAYSIRVGQLPGVDTIFSPLSHLDMVPNTGAVEASAVSVCMQMMLYHYTTFGRQSDIEVVWGAGGAIASVRDLTFSLDVPFGGIPGSNYGFVPDGNGNGMIDWVDMVSVEEVSQVNAHLAFCGEADGLIVPAAGAGTQLTNVAAVTPVSNLTEGLAGADFTATGTGFGLYLAGHFHIFQLTGGALPAEGTRWVLRSVSGPIEAATNPETSNPEGYTFTQNPGNPAVTGLQFRFVVPASTAKRATTDDDLARVHTVPDPYYVTSAFEQTTDTKIIKFVNLPADCIIRIYSSSGVLVALLEHHSATLGGSEDWNVRNRNNQVVASGVYFYHIESGDARRVGRFTVVNFAQ